LNKPNEVIHSIEVVSDGTRIPVVQQVIKEVFETETLSRTMNSQDCIARGCAIQAAQLKVDFKTSNYILEGN
jgi:heat shock protein 4